MPGGNDLTGPALKVNPAVTKVSDAIEYPVWNKVIEDAIKATNKNPDVCQNNTWCIQKFRICAIDFSVETDELTPTFKLKRSQVSEKYAELIEDMYK